MFLGKGKFNTLYSLSRETCSLVKETETPLELHMTMSTTIHEHLSTLYMLTVEFNLKNIVELGTWNGESTIALLEAAKEIDGRVTSIDIDSCLEAKKLVKSLDLEDRWTFIQADDLRVEWNQPIDHLFIDTSHTYEHTIAELTKYEPFVRSCGLITLHDIVSWPNVLSAITQYIHGRKDIKFYKYFNNNGLGVLRKR